jgi:hypothetical protein
VAWQFWDISQHYKVKGYPTVKIFVPAERATSHAGGEAEATDMTGLGGADSIVQAGCAKKREVLERVARNKPAGGSKILAELESLEDTVTLLHGTHATSAGARAVVLLLAAAGAAGGPCGLEVEPVARYGWLQTAAMAFKAGREKSVSCGARPFLSQ